MIILGSTGMLGQALIKAARLNNFKVIGVARSNADVALDVLDFEKLILLVLVFTFNFYGAAAERAKGK